MLKAALTTLGCKVNQSETESIIKDFEALGVEVVGFNQPADIYIINTCTVTRTSDHKSKQLIRRAIRQCPESLIVVTGCCVDRAGGELANIEGVELVIPNGQKPRLASLVWEKISSQKSLQLLSPPNSRDASRRSWRQVRHTRALVKVEDGCDKYCSFCIVPYVRGGPVSRSAEEVTSEVEGLIKGGVKEVVLTGVSLGSYLSQSNSSQLDLAGLIEKVLLLPGLGRLRLSSVELRDVTSPLVDLMQNCSKFCRHLHIPLQSGDNKVLKRMNRPYTSEEYLEAIGRIREKIPGVAITTDVIVGFPGEEEASFTQTLRVIREAAFRKMHIFKYSPRPGTLASSLEDRIEPEVKERRSKELIKLGKSLSQKFIDGFREKSLEVVVEKEVERGLLRGLSDNYIQVYFRGPSRLQGSLVRVRDLRPERESLYGQLEEEKSNV